MVRKQSLKTWNPRSIVWQIHLLFNYYPCVLTHLLSFLQLSGARYLVLLWWTHRGSYWHCFWYKESRILNGYCIILLPNSCFCGQNGFALRCPLSTYLFQYFDQCCTETLKLQPSACQGWFSYSCFILYFECKTSVLHTLGIYSSDLHKHSYTLKKTNVQLTK